MISKLLTVLSSLRYFGPGDFGHLLTASQKKLFLSCKPLRQNLIHYIKKKMWHEAKIAYSQNTVQYRLFLPISFPVSGKWTKIEIQHVLVVTDTIRCNITGNPY